MKKVIIIGAGPGGLTAAAEILEQPEDFSVTVLEASDAIGGISQTVRHNGNRMDIGGHRFFSKDDRIMNWWSERMPLQGADSYDDKKLGRSKPLVSTGPVSYTHLDVYKRQILYQLAKINSSVRCKVKKNFIVVESVFYINQLHVQLVFIDFLLADFQCFLLFFLVFGDFL